jgi:hypothetical protein
MPAEQHRLLAAACQPCARGGKYRLSSLARWKLQHYHASPSRIAAALIMVMLARTYRPAPRQDRRPLAGW